MIWANRGGSVPGLRLVFHGVDGDAGIGVNRPLQIVMRTVHSGEIAFLASDVEISAAATSAAVMPAA
jgi:hypothetical protein